MAKKKVKKRSSVKKTVKKKTSPRKKLKMMPRKKIVNNKIITFLILFAVSVVLYYATNIGTLNDIFYFAMIIFGSLVLAFIIIRLVIFFLDVFKKK